VIIDNKAGAGGTLGTDYVAKARPTATRWCSATAARAPPPSLLRKLPYDVIKDFRPISGVVTVPLILAVAADSPHKTVKDFVAWARSQGTTLNYGSTGIGGSSHLYRRVLQRPAGTRSSTSPTPAARRWSRPSPGARCTWRS
jgi:tripartite-type tricarboxylate transporter receptor subunit TctC